MSRTDASIIVKLDAFDHPIDAVDALALAPFVNGSQPYARSEALQRVKRDHTLLPAGVEPIRSAHDRNRSAVLARGHGWTIRVTRFANNAANVSVTATSDDLARRMLHEATHGAVESAPEADEERATLGFWYRGQRPMRRERTLDVTTWAHIRANYNASATAAFDRLVTVTPADIEGRLLLFYGPPGTGKTTVLRALTYERREWCQVDYVVDPDRLFADSQYLLSVALDHDDSPKPWRLLVLEDCDELIRAQAKTDTGQSLARLLNLADGLPGQGVQLLIAITTNEPITALHPAIVRPGRCLAQIDVGRLSALEARAWLGRAAFVGPDGATLAELYAQRGDVAVVENTPDDVAPVGKYL